MVSSNPAGRVSARQPERMANRATGHFGVRDRGVGMFERFTDRARRVLVCAQEEARLLHVLISLGAGLELLRKRVLEVLAVSPAPGKDHEARLEPEAPRCARCGAALADSARYRSIEAGPGDEADEGHGHLSATVLYCSRCGGVIGPVLETGSVLRVPLATTVGVGPAPAAPPPERRFSDELLAPVRGQDVPEEARVDLVYRSTDVLEGTVGGTAVRVRGRVGPRGGPVRGTWGGVAVSWRLADKLGKPPERTVGTVSSRVGDAPVHLEGAFQVGPRYLFEQAGITGDLGGQSLTVKLSAVDAGPASTSVVVAEGTVGEEPLEIFAALVDGSARAVVRGSLGGRPVSLDATHDETSVVRILGEYTGPLPLLALVVGVVVHFL
jgi:hypothetical protein